MSIRRYSELSKIQTFEDRFEYLRLNGAVGTDTFGFERYLNQFFYRSSRWKKVRDLVIVRDNGCDLGFVGRDIYGKIFIHHMNPITKKDLEEESDILLNPEFLITVSFETHNAIHYGDISLLPRDPIERKKNDTCPWKKD